jgi:3-isopropylmalate dehydrogenase
LNQASQADSILFGAVGGPKWDSLPPNEKPEKGLLELRSSLGLFANLRPAILFDSSLEASSLKPDIIKDLDTLIVRELTGGIYFGEPRGKKSSSAFNTMIYERHEVERIARVAFDSASLRNKKVCSVDKSNVLEVSEFWREVVIDVSKDYPDIELSHMLVDNAAMQLVKNPKQFDVILSSNLFGDILSDISAMLTGSIGMLPSASLNNRNKGLYEPVHGSAPDIAGQGTVNPIAMILSVGMMFRYSLDQLEISEKIKSAVSNTLNDGYATEDIADKNSKICSTKELTKIIIDHV